MSNKEEKKFTCGAPTKSGEPCKIKVSEEGKKCHIHSKEKKEGKEVK